MISRGENFMKSGKKEEVISWIHQEPELEYERVQGTLRDTLTPEEMDGVGKDIQFLSSMIKRG
jgi:hypothetical protein